MSIKAQSKKTIKHDSLDFVNVPDEVVISKDEEHTRIMTYNVHGFKDRSNITKLKDILKVIESIDPDILVLEEIFIYKRNEMVTEEELKTKLKDIGLVHCTFSKNGINAVFSKCQFKSTELDLGRDAKFKLSRNAIVCRFDNLVFVGTHLDVFDESGTLRKKQMELILAHITKLTKESKIEKFPIIISGDFNSLRSDDYSSDEWRTITAIDKQRGVETVVDVVPLIKKEDFVDSFESCNKSVKVSVWAKRRVDYIYGKNIEFKTSAVYRKTFSDHYPVYADF